MYCPPSISSFLIHLPPAHLEVADSRGPIKTIRQWMHKILSRRGPSLVHPILDIWTTFVPAKMVHISKKYIRENVFQETILSWRYLWIKRCVDSRARADEEGKHARRHNKKARDFTHPFIHKSTLLSKTEKSQKETYIRSPYKRNWVYVPPSPSFPHKGNVCLTSAVVASRRLQLLLICICALSCISFVILVTCSMAYGCLFIEIQYKSLSTLSDKARNHLKGGF